MSSSGRIGRLIGNRLSQLFGSPTARPSEAAPDNAGEADVEQPTDDAQVADDPWEDRQGATPSDTMADDLTEPPAESAGPDDDETASADGVAEDDDDAQALDRWLVEFYAGQHDGDRMQPLVAPLQTMLQATDPAERHAAALVLVPLGKARDVLPMVLAGARDDAQRLEASARVLRWLAWELRSQLFWQLHELAGDDTQRAQLIGVLSQTSGPRQAQLLWRLFDETEPGPVVLQAIDEGLREYYYGSWYFDADDITRQMRSRALAELTPQLESGPATRRIVALNLLLPLAEDQTRQGAEILMNDATLPPAQRQDAYRLWLSGPAVRRTNAHSNRRSASVGPGTTPNRPPPARHGPPR